MDQQKVFLTILGMTLVTYVPRFLPAWLLANREVPPRLAMWLRFVPPAVIASMLLPWLVLDKGEFVGMQNIGLWVALPTLVCALMTRNFFGTVAAGVVMVAAVRYFL